MPRRLTIAFVFILASSVAFSRSEDHLSRQLTVAPGGLLVVDVSFGNIEITPTADQSLNVEVRREVDLNNDEREKQFLADQPVIVEQNGNTVTIRAKRDRNISWSWRGNVSMDAQYAVRVPKNFNLDLKTGGGSVSARGIEGESKVATSGGKLKCVQVRGPVEAKTSGGSIELEQCDGSIAVKTSGGEIVTRGGSGNLNARTSGGSIAVRDFKGEAKLETSGGQLNLENIGGAITGGTSGGSVRADLPSPLPGDVSLTSSAGSIVLIVPKDAALTLRADADIGSVSSSLPVVVSRSSRNHLTGTINGGGKSVVLRASAGSISIESPEAKTAKAR